MAQNQATRGGPLLHTWKWLKSHPCKTILTITVLVFAALIATGRSGTLTLFDVAVMNIAPGRPLPACTQLIATVHVLNLNLAQQAAKLKSYQENAINFETSNASPDLESTWGTAVSDQRRWGSNLFVDEANWVTITSQRQVVVALMDKVAATLSDIKKNCKLE
jgi:hypothetical protein